MKRCENCGHVTLSPAERQAYEAAQRGVTASELAEALGIGYSAAFMRLERLLNSGLLSAKGSPKRYTVCRDVN